MILKLTKQGTIEIEPQRVPESLKNIFISYKYPRGLNHLKPVLVWGGETYEGDNVYISKNNINFNMKVLLYNGQELFKEYRCKQQPELFIAYNIKQLRPDIIEHIKKIETENKTLKEKGDII